MTKYAAVISPRCRTMVADGVVRPYNGATPLLTKKRPADTHIDRPRLAKLNSVCGPFIRQRNEIRRPSSASTSAPTSGPKSSTEVKANTSETEKRDWIDGILMLSVPLSTVSTANSSHSPG